MMNHTEIDTSRPLYPTQELSFVVIPLLKGVIYEEDNQALWSALLNQLAGIRDYVAVLGLELIVDEAEGYAFLRSQPETGAEAQTPLPALWQGGSSVTRSACCWHCCVKSLLNLMPEPVIHV